MHIPINPEYVRNRRKKYGTDGNFMTMPTTRPELVGDTDFSVRQEVCERYFQNKNNDNYRVELVQAAAVIVAMIENLDSGEEV